jgi:uncharacterized protein with HEPN domain
MTTEEQQDALMRNIEAETRSLLPSLDWKAMCGMRDVLDYIGVDLDEVWNVAFLRIPELQSDLERFLSDESHDRGAAAHE